MSKTPLARLLIVEDEALVATQLKLRLARLGYDVVGLVDTGEAALLVAAEQQPEIVLMDIQLAGAMDGITAAEQLRVQFNIPVIYLTAYTDTGQLERTKKNPPLGYLAKPFDERALRATLEIALYKYRLDQKLQESERRYRELFEGVLDIVFTLDDQNNFTSANPACERILGYTPAELLQMNVTQIIPAPQLQRLLQLRDANLRLKNSEVRFESAVRAKDGHEVLVEIKSTLLFKNGVYSGLHGIARDITERKQIEARELEQRLLAEALRDAAAALSSSLDFESVLDAILDNIARVVPHDTASIMLLDEHSFYTRTVRHRNPRHLPYPPLETLSFDLRHKATFQRIIETAQPVILADTAQDPEWVSIEETKWIRSYAGMPIRSRAQIIGFLNLDSAELNFFTPAHAERLKAFADQCAVAVENVRLYQASQQEAARTRALVHISKRLNAQLDLTTVLQAICEETAQLLNVPAVSIALYNPETDMYERSAEIGLPPELTRSILGVPRDMYEKYMTESGQVVPDLRQMPETPLIKIYRQSQVCTMASSPMKRDRQRVGALNVFAFNAPRIFAENELALLTGLADQAAQAITNARLFQETTLRYQYAEVLHHILFAITSSIDLKMTLRVIVDQITTELRLDACDILLYAPLRGRLEHAASHGFRNQDVQRTSVRLGGGLAGRAALENSIIYLADMTKVEDPTLNKFIKSEGFAVYYGIPLIAKNKVLGVLEIFHRQPLQPDPERARFLDDLGKQVAVAIDNAQLLQDLQSTHDELALAYDATIEGWAQAMELRDREDKGHSERVSELTVALARQMGMGDHELIHIRRGAMLHDIGKMSLPDAILFKQAPLTEEEWAIIRQHPNYAYEILASNVYLRRVIDIPYCHHERWDGAGYPRGLRGEAIPLAARIFAVVNEWDSLRQDRQYRPAFSTEETLRRIRAQTGTQFDPKVVEEFFKLIKQEQQNEGALGNALTHSA